MAEEDSRAYDAGRTRAESIVKDLDLNYQCRTTTNYLHGLFSTLYEKLHENGHIRNPKSKASTPVKVEEIMKETLKKYGEL